MPQPRPTPTPDELRAAIDAAGLNQSEIAARWGISRETINGMVRGRRVIRGWVADALAGLKDSQKICSQ